VIEPDLELQIMVFIILYILTFSITTLLLSAMGLDGITSLSASITTIGNVGPGFGEVSSLGNYSQLPGRCKIRSFCQHVTRTSGDYECLSTLSDAGQKKVNRLSYFPIPMIFITFAYFLQIKLENIFR